ncbi:MAG: hypothetical protein E6R07_09275 [Nevskiaceae bacterium]|nr:MAG: hypothetical protein E6R07_09275 [Nevskiaceae bacterium]
MSADPDADEEARLFREAMRDVARKSTSNRRTETKRPPAPIPLQREADERAVLREMLAGSEIETLESGDTLSYRAPGVQDGVLRKLRRGQFHVQKELDLHGLSRSKAQEAVMRFLAYCQDQQLRCVRIIHGKGHGSPNSGPVLKAALDSWLRRRKDVAAYCSARAVDGGTGAVYVLLRQPR